MRWQLIWGPRQGYISTLQRYGKPLPAEYLARPKLSRALTFYLEAFWDMSTDRQIGMGEGPIPFSAIDRLAVRLGLDPGAFQRLKSLIRTMDHEYLRIRAQKPDIDSDDDDPTSESRLQAKKALLAKRARQG